MSFGLFSPKHLYPLSLSLFTCRSSPHPSQLPHTSLHPHILPVEQLEQKQNSASKRAVALAPVVGMMPNLSMTQSGLDGLFVQMMDHKPSLELPPSLLGHQGGAESAHFPRPALQISSWTLGGLLREEEEVHVMTPSKVWSAHG